MKLYDIDGLACAACASSAQKVLGRTQGVSEVRVNYATKTAAIEAAVSMEALNQRLDKLGFKLYPKDRNAHQARQKRVEEALQQLRRALLIGGAFALPLFIIAMFIPTIPYANFIMFGLTLPILWTAGKRFFVSAFKQALLLKVNMDSLVALGTGAAFLLSTFNTFFPEVLEQNGMEAHVYFEAAGVLLIFVLFGKYLEQNASRQTSAAIESLLELQVDTVQLLENGEEKTLPIEVIQAGDCLKIRPGNVVPLDGVIVNGSASIDESMLTGEALPVQKEKAADVFAGTIVQQGSFEMEVTNVGAETVLSKIIALVEAAQNTQIPVQKLVDRIAAIFVPVVMLIALATLLVWGMNGWWLEGLVAAITVLVVACPCALGLATPTAITIGIGAAARQGILIRTAASIEKTAGVDAIVLDKTGTITEGEPTISKMVWNVSAEEQLILELYLLSLENESEHPLAQAVVDYYEKKNIKTANAITDFANYSGLGIAGNIDGKSYFVGNEKLMQQQGIEIPARLLNLQEEAKTWGYFANEAKILAAIAFEDAIKTSSKAAIEQLQRKGKTIYMLTGDNSRIAALVASKVGITDFKASVMPEDKIAFVQELQAKGQQVMMVGDGINDAPALAQADVGVAMNSGTAVAVESADVVLRHNDLMQLKSLFNASIQMARVIRQNLFWAFIYNLLLIPVAAGLLSPWGWVLNPMLAGAAMALSSVIVVFNSLRLKAVDF